MLHGGRSGARGDVGGGVLFNFFPAGGNRRIVEVATDQAERIKALRDEVFDCGIVFGIAFGMAGIGAAILGFLVGMVIVSQTIYATTMENLEEFETLKALGATRWYIIRIVLTQALICGAIGCALGVAVTFPLVQEARKAIPWVETPWWLPAGMIGPSLMMCCAAAIASIRAALTVEPAKVFRA